MKRLRTCRHSWVTSALSATLCLAFALNAYAAQISIDEFTEPSVTARSVSSGSGGAQTQWTDPDGSGTYSATDGVIGNVRDGSLGCESYENTSNVAAAVGQGVLDVSSTGNSTPSIYLSYDGTRGWPTNAPETERFNGVFGTPQDLSGYSEIVFGFSSLSEFDFGVGTTGGFNDFQVFFLQGAPAGEYNNSSYWYSYDAATAGELGGANDLDNSSDPQEFAIPFSSLTTSGGSSTTFNAVQAIQIHICSSDLKSDYTLDYIRATPEPSTALALMLGCGFVGLSRRRRTG